MQLLYFICNLLVVTIPLTQATPFLERKTNYVLHEKRVAHPAWTKTRRLEGHVALPLRIGLKQNNLDLLPEYLMSVSDPSSPSYAQHWTQEEVVKKFAPSEEAHSAVREWLVAAGFEASRVRRSYNGAWVDVHNATSSEVEWLLDTQYHIYEHKGAEHIACDSYSLPRAIADVVDIVIPTVQHNIKLDTRSVEGRQAHSSAREGSKVTARAVVDVTTPTGCDKIITPDCLRALYNITYTPQATDKNTFGIVGYAPNIYLQSDLDAFFRNFSPALVGKSPSLVSINGGNIEQGDAGEDSWVLEYAMTLAQPQPVTFMQVGGQPSNTDIQSSSFNEWLDAVDGSYCTSGGGDDFTYDPQIPSPFPGGLTQKDCGTVKSPNVVSTSKGDHEYFFSQFYLERQCNEFAKLGLMGVTVLFSAGNTGASGARSGVCLDENGSMNYNGTKFNPTWPAACPWLTAVGGTQVKANTTDARPGVEEVWNEELLPGKFESGGGGFSNRFSAPSYQKKTISNYLSSLKKSDPSKLKHFNINGRGFPDLSANARAFVNVGDGETSISSGTSGATPTVAAIITLVNDARIAAGKKPVGFINPTIYSPEFANAFNDIVSGASQGCKGLQGENDGGFKAGEGWDPASGLGTPNLGLLIEKWLALP